ncbi:conserved hypothetical protein [Caulobacter phage Cd1]|uniref:Uncharacterized protein n=1 Tax=Caulobacter phage Cd1 TaxID=718008 RepID=F1ADQ2_9CAUD|nr:conserved hypothetical protein [Caulobacter phage Cd1]
MVDINKLANLAAEKGPDQTQAVKGGGGKIEVPEAGPVRLRLISYIEIGKHEKKYKDETKTVEQVMLQFELHGPKHPAKNEETGRDKPLTIWITENLSMNEKANYFKLFNRLNQGVGAKHMAQLVGKDFLGTIVHKVVGEGDNKRTYANLRNADGYTIRPPFVEQLNEETGEIDRKRVPVPEPINPLQIFLWDFADKDQWDSIFIDGHWPDKKDDDGNVVEAGKSKNWLQQRIRAAVNFKGSPADQAAGGADELDLGGVTEPERSDTPEKPKQADTGTDPLDDIPF